MIAAVCSWQWPQLCCLSVRVCVSQCVGVYVCGLVCDLVCECLS